MLYQWTRGTIAWSHFDPLTSSPAGAIWNQTYPDGGTNGRWDMTFPNNPCPSGYRVPTAELASSEENGELDKLAAISSVWITSAQAKTLGLGCTGGRIFGTTIVPATYAAFNVNAMLFIPATGGRFFHGELIPNRWGEFGTYWSDRLGLEAIPLTMSFISTSIPSIAMNVGYGYAYSVRCVRD
jgi:hypothetical protein